MREWISVDNYLSKIKSYDYSKKVLGEGLMKKGILTIATILSFTLSACSSEGDSSNSEDRSDCDIKGNISYNTGEKIYHLPEDQFYDVTEIDESYGEEWFCTEEEAEEAGFRRSQR